MEHHTVQRNKLVCNIPEEDINHPVDKDEASSETQVVFSYADAVRKASVSVSNEENRPEILGISLDGTSDRCLKKRLLVLDINGLLADIVSPPPKGHKADAIIAGRAGEKRLYYVFMNF